ncbi:hypothetical protein LA080_009492 [Diaporthe eres]|nr:hypothetical protein LA080_009492 [Diaporthe eres]
MSLGKACSRISDHACFFDVCCNITGMGESADNRLYGPYFFSTPILSLLWQSAEFFKAARNIRDTGFSAASHRICDLFFGVAGLVPAILFTVVFQELAIFFDENMLFDSDGNAFDLGIVHVGLTLGHWMSTVFIWSDGAPAYHEPSSKRVLTVGHVAATHQVSSEVLAQNEPQEVGDSTRAVEMPGANPDEMSISVVSVGGTRRSNEQDSLQLDT